MEGGPISVVKLLAVPGDSAGGRELEYSVPAHAGAVIS